MREAIREADVILGVDVHEAEKMYLFYGESPLADSDGYAESDVVKVTVDFFTDDLEVLWAACVAIKGSCCYDEFASVLPVQLSHCA